VQEVRR